ncbi:hypothetical protein [Xenorhabdus ishibashii]|uniref:Peptidase C80 domain-containing protein n=1 Tax=Xenorhabdus ishibashii TaxID=1034471 RepID=A0A2D0KC95_9GAMM|nr:hypothetical protein [Xenorhabdus ishibashii]PHM61000.1 hypothetical protein Xish_00107 [Xenorhabdus ishibashii]
MGQYRHTISNIIAMPDDVLLQQTVEVNFHQEKRFHYFLDTPRHKSGDRLNIIGHSSPVGRTILFAGASAYNPGMNLNVFCQTIKALLTDIRSRGQNILCVRIIACYSGSNGLAQKLADYINMPVKGSLGGTRVYPTTQFRSMPNVNRHFIDKTDRGGHYYSEEEDRQLRHDPAYGLYQWYYPQSSDPDSAFDAFANQRVSRLQRSEPDSAFDAFANQRVSRLQRSEPDSAFDAFANQRVSRLQRSEPDSAFDAFANQRVSRLRRSEPDSAFDSFVNQRVSRPQHSDSDSEFDAFVNQRVPRKNSR